MKILPLVKGIQNDIASSGIRIKQASVNGYRIAQRTSKIYRQCPVIKYCNISKSVSDKVFVNTTRKELPYVLGAIGTVLPVPLMGPFMFGVGLLVRFLYRNND